MLNVLTEDNLHLVGTAMNEVKVFLARIVGRVDRCKIGLEVKTLTVIAGHFRRAVNNGGAEFHHGGICECLQYNLIANTIGVAMSDAYFDFAHIVRCLEMLRQHQTEH